MIDGLPGGAILSVGAIILVTIFFVTSCDSGSLVVDMLASGGAPNPPKWSRVVWACTEGLVAIALMRGQNRQRQEQLGHGVRSDVTSNLTGNFDQHFEEPVTRVVERVVRRERVRK